jgi:hypothetical protein
MYTDITATRHALDALLEDLDAVEAIVPLEQLAEPLRGNLERAVGRAFLAYQRELDALFSPGCSPDAPPAAASPGARGTPSPGS